MRVVGGKYELREEIGRGGFGAVWRAWDRALGRAVAIKFLTARLPEEMARFEREARTAAGLSHPNIVAVFEVGEDAGERYIVMECVEGVPANRAGLDPRGAVETIRQAATALQCAHEAGVIHRDLKPANILVAPGPRAKVADFGMAKRVGVESSISMTGDIVGTPAYMSPEQARGQLRSLDARSDVWSLGATLYALCAGRAPFEASGADVYETLRRVIEEEPAPFRSLDRDLQTVILKCLEKDPSRRYASARDLADDLGRFLAGEPVSARAPSLAYRVRKKLAKRKALTAATAVAVAALLAAVLVELRRLYLERTVVPIVERARERVREADQMTLKPAFREGEWRARLDAAEHECRRAIGIHDAYAPAHLVLGLVEAQRGRFDEAIAAFDEAIRRNPDYELAYIERAKAFTERVFSVEHSSTAVGRSPKQSRREAEWTALAQADLGRATRTDRTLVDLIAAMLANRDDQALRKLSDDAYARWESGDADEHVLRIGAEAAHRAQDPARAVLCMEAYLDVRRSDATGWTRLSHFYFEADRAADAVAAADKALALRPALALACSELGFARNRMGDPVGAATAHARAVALAPDEPRVWYGRAIFLNQRGDLDGAEGDYRRTLALEPEFVDARVALADLLYKRGDLADAARECTDVLRLEPENAGALLTRALAAEAAGDRAAADADFAGAVEADPRSPANFIFRAQARCDRGDWAGAIADLDAALEMEPRNADVLSMRGRARERAGDVGGAIDDYSRAVVIDPSHSGAWTNRGSLFRGRGELREALADYDRAVALTPRNAYLHLMRADTLANLDALDAALAAYDAALGLDDTLAGAYGNRAVLRMRRDDVGGAIDDFSRGLALEPRNAVMLANRAICHSLREDWEAAAADLRDALEAAPDRGDLRDALREVERKLADF